ncbi:MAG: SDR family oxidoreductase [Pseudomonadota bacterium]
MTNLTGQSVLITGASQGIGAATARHMAAQGARVALLARNEDALVRLAKETGGHAIPCDVSNPRAVSDAVDGLVRSAGRIDVLVNNAGIIDPIARLGDSDPDAWGHVVDVNLKGAYHMMRAVLPEMDTCGAGTIINLSSGAATSALEGWSHYCATKAALLSLTRVVHREYGERGIRVLGLSPGTVATEMQERIKASGINPVSQLAPEDHIAPQDVARAISWLCTPEADKHLGTDFSLKTAQGRSDAGLPPRH